MSAIRKIYNLYLSPQKHFSGRLKLILGFAPLNISLYRLAFLHSSVSGKLEQNNERLEFLGDAVLDNIVTEYLFQKYLFKGEGFLTEMRSKIVNRKKLNEIAFDMGLDEFVSSVQIRNLEKHSILGNTLEALIGAAYIDQGYKKAKQFVLKKIVAEHVDFSELEALELNYKGKLIEWAQGQGKRVQYEFKGKNSKIFVVEVLIEGIVIGEGEGYSKKAAEQNAAKSALDKISSVPDS